MAATIIQWNVRGLRCNRRDVDVLINGLPMCQLWLLSQIAEEESWPVAVWRSLFRLTLTSKRLWSRSHWVVLLSLSFLFTSQATTTFLPEICHIWSETSKDRYLSWVTLMDTTICGVVMMLTPRVKSLRDSQTNTICVFSMTEPTTTWNPKPSMWTNQHQR